MIMQSDAASTKAVCRPLVYLHASHSKNVNGPQPDYVTLFLAVHLITNAGSAGKQSSKLKNWPTKQSTRQPTDQKG